jgi:hypothetical protein
MKVTTLKKKYGEIYDYVHDEVVIDVVAAIQDIIDTVPLSEEKANKKIVFISKRIASNAAFFAASIHHEIVTRKK